MSGIEDVNFSLRYIAAICFWLRGVEGQVVLAPQSTAMRQTCKHRDQWSKLKWRIMQHLCGGRLPGYGVRSISHCQDNAELRVAAHHAGVSLGRFFERIGFNYGTYAG
jgi:hypothetical protein